MTVWGREAEENNHIRKRQTKQKDAKEMSLKVGFFGVFFELQFLKNDEAAKEHRKN